MGIPVIPTERLVLRPWSEDDAGAMYQLWTHAAVRCQMWDGELISLERAKETVREAVRSAGSEGVGYWTVARAPAPDAAIGFCGLRHFRLDRRLELLVALLPQYWGRGFATEACSAALGYAFQRGYEAVFARTTAENRKSVRLLERLGMRIDASSWIDDSSDLCFSLSREEVGRQRRTKRAVCASQSS